MDPDLIRPISNPAAINQAVEIISAGGVIGFPTDTVYGIGCSAFNPEAIQRLYHIKKRDSQKGIPILAADPEDASALSREFPRSAAALAARFWPGPLTLILPANPALPDNLSPADTIGVRIPDYPPILTLLSRSGPLAATSANLSGQPSALTADDLLEQLGDQLDFVLDGGPVLGGESSTVLDLTVAPPKLLRAGPISFQSLLAALEDG